MKQYLNSGELIPNQSQQIGLFTFYKQQEGEEESQQRTPFRFRHKYSPGKQADQEKIEQKQTHLNKSVNCEEFLRNIRVNQPQRIVYKGQKTESGLEEASSQTQIKTNMLATKKRNENYNLLLGRMKTKSFKKFEQEASMDEVEPISTELIRKKYFNSERQTAAIDHITRIDSKEKPKDRALDKRRQLRFREGEDALIYRTFLVDSQKRDQIKIRLRQYKEKMKDDDKVSRKRLISNRDTSSNKATSINKNMHQKNKIYFNKLMENMSFQPQSNQTAYKILRETLKFPHFSVNSQEHIKTEGNSPQRKEFPINSYYYNSKINIKSKQNNLYSKNSLKKVIGNRLIFRKIAQK